MVGFGEVLEKTVSDPGRDWSRRKGLRHPAGPWRSSVFLPRFRPAVVFIQSGIRERGRAATLDKAWEAAKSVARQLSEGTGHVHTLSPTEVAEYTPVIRQLRAVPRVQLPEVTSIFNQATAILKDPARICTQAKAARVPLILRLKILLLLR